MSTGIGAVVITRNESANIEACLASLAFCDERLVVDSFSEDDTVERALPLAEHVVRRDFVHHAEQKNWALDRLATRWALIVDADERVSQALATELVGCARQEEVHGYWLHRDNRFFGRRITGAGWRRDRVLRFLRRGCGRYGESFLHEEVVIDPGHRVGTCRARLDHFSYEDWSSTFSRFLTYTRRGAHERVRRGRRARPASLVTAPIGRFLRQFLVQGGWRDGVHGFALCGWSASGVMMRQARMMLGDSEHGVEDRAPTGPPRVEVVQGLEGRPLGTADEERA